MVKYADRAFLSVNGAKIADLQRASLKRNFNAKAVGTMTPDGFNRGAVEGNMDVDIDFEIAIQNQLATPKIEMIDFYANDVALTWICGADQFVASGLYRKSASEDASGIGSEAKKSWTFGALKCTDAVGNSALFPLNLSLA